MSVQWSIIAGQVPFAAQPIGEVNITSRFALSDFSFGADPDAAYAAAVVPEFGAWAPGDATAEGFKYNHNPGYNGATVKRAQIKWRFYTSTCYLKISWDEVITSTRGGDGDGDSSYSYHTEISRTPIEWTWEGLSEGGICLPLDFVYEDQDTWPETLVYDLIDAEPPAPPDPGYPPLFQEYESYRTRFENVRFSFVDGYTPPDDGTANGFPV